MSFSHGAAGGHTRFRGLIAFRDAMHSVSISQFDAERFRCTEVSLPARCIDIEPQRTSPLFGHFRACHAHTKVAKVPSHGEESAGPSDRPALVVQVSRAGVSLRIGGETGTQFSSARHEAPRFCRFAVVHSRDSTTRSSCRGVGLDPLFRPSASFSLQGLRLASAGFFKPPDVRASPSRFQESCRFLRTRFLVHFILNNQDSSCSMRAGSRLFLLVSCVSRLVGPHRFRRSLVGTHLATVISAFKSTVGRVSGHLSRSSQAGVRR